MNKKELKDDRGKEENSRHFSLLLPSVAEKRKTDDWSPAKENEKDQVKRGTG